MVRLVVLAALLSLSSAVQAKDYFGVSFGDDNRQAVCDKAGRVFADCVIEDSGDAVVQGNGLLRFFFPYVGELRVAFNEYEQAYKLRLTTKPMQAKSVTELVDHLREDYDLEGKITQLSAENVIDKRQHRWDIAPLCADTTQSCRYEISVLSNIGFN